jgi:hypothetical protein
MDTIFNGLSRRRKVGSPGAYDERDFAIGEPAFKLSPGEAMGFGYARTNRPPPLIFLHGRILALTSDGRWTCIAADT